MRKFKNTSYKKNAPKLDESRIPTVLSKVEMLWKQNPHMNLGKLLHWATGKDELNYVKDNELISRINNILED